jgi:inosine/xanthosine triphosphatase
VSAHPVSGPLGRIERVRVGSRNEPKIAAVRSAFADYCPAVLIEGADVASGVSEQPVGYGEIIEGARNRAVAARAAADCDLGVGIEDGLVALPPPAAEVGCDHVNVGCAVITDGVRFAAGFSSAFAYPPSVAEPALRNRAPIGELFDGLWREQRRDRDGAPSGRSIGNIGKLTAGVLTRAEYGRHAVLCALVAYLNPDLYGGGTPS